MTATRRRLLFGVFMGPLHRIGENPTLALRRDLELVRTLDELGYEEAWVGEHHSYGREIIADPALFIAMAAAQTGTIRLGTGVTSLPYHHPFIVADRMVQLDHMTRGRVMLGVGPGALPSDAYMLGIAPETQRPRMEEALGAILALLRAEAPVSIETDWFTLRDARLQLASYSDPHLPVSVATSVTPSGALAAGRHGTGLLSVAGADHDAFGRTWGWVEEGAAEAGRVPDRRTWRVVVPFHLAESRQRAIREVRDGYRERPYRGDRNNPDMGAAGVLFANLRGSRIEAAIERDAAIIGTPEDAIAAVERIWERSGGLGGVLNLAHEWASPAATLRSYELWARYVAPHFQGQLAAPQAHRDWLEENEDSIFQVSGALGAAYVRAGKEVPQGLSEFDGGRGA